MFKKSNRNFRTKKAESESDEEETNVIEQVVIPKQQQIKIINKIETNKDNKTEIKQTTSSQSLKVLSFNDVDLENEEGSVEFKVKKSKESRRLVKEVKKSKKDKERGLKLESNTIVLKSESSNSNDILYNEGIKVKPLKINEELYVQSSKSKYLINKYKDIEKNSDEEFEDYKNKIIKSEDESSSEKSDENDEEANRLEILRKEMEILNGNDDDQIENEKDETKRSMKVMLKSGIIPDASLIHAARKKREMARQGDYISIGKSKNGSESRAVREDDDLSDDDLEDKKRVSMNYREIAHKERQETRNNFLAYEEGSDVEEVNEEEDEMERWEKEQIRKGVLISQALPSKLDFKNIKKEQLIEIIGKNEDEEAIERESKPLDFEKLNNLPQITFLTIKDTLRSNLKSLEETLRVHQNEHNMTLENLNANKTQFENLKTSRPILDEQYIYFQEMKAYIRDFVECYNEKIAEIEKAESKMLTLYKQRAEKLSERFLQDIRDQNFEATNSNSGNKKPIDPAHQRRMNEREQRREKRRKTREKVIIELDNIDGLSTDEEESQTDENVFKQKKDDILNQLNQIESDIAEDFFQYGLIKERFDKWKKLSPSTYRNSYVALSLPKLFSPLIRYEIVDWNPLEDTSVEKLENFKWFKELISYNKQDLLRLPREEIKLEDDHLLISNIVDKTVLPKLISIAENVYNPISSKQSRNLAKLVFYLIKDYSTVNSQSQNTKKLIETIIARLRKSIDQDIFVPLYSKQIIQQTNSESSIFFNRQIWSCIKLFSNILNWKETLNDSILKELSIDRLLNRYLLIAFQNLDSDMNTIFKIEYLIKQIPTEWFFITGEPSLAQTKLLSMCNLIKRISDSIYENEFKTKNIDIKEFRGNILRISKLLSLMGAHDQAILLTNQFENKL